MGSWLDKFLQNRVHELGQKQGRGNWGHVGRPGQVGGSAPQVTLGPAKEGSLFSTSRILTPDGDVGYVQWKKQGREVKVNEIVVDKSQQGKGVGSTAVLQLMKQAGVTTVHPSVVTGPGRRLFEALERVGVDVNWGVKR